MFFREGNIKNVPVELIEINKFEKPYELPNEGLIFKHFIRYAPLGATCYAPMYVAASDCGKVQLTLRLRGVSDVEATLLYKDGKYSTHINNAKRLGFTIKSNSSGLFVEKNAYRIGVGAPLSVDDEVASRNGICKVLLVTGDSVILSDEKQKTILVRRNDESAMKAHGFDWIDVPEDNS